MGEGSIFFVLYSFSYWELSILGIHKWGKKTTSSPNFHICYVVGAPSDPLKLRRIGAFFIQFMHC